MFRVHSNKIVDISSKIAAVGLAIAVLYNGFVWVDDFVEISITTEPEADVMITESMDAHNKAIEETPYAMKDDVNHLVNDNVNERVGDAVKERCQLLKKQQLNPDEFTELDAYVTKQLAKDIDEYKEDYVPEESHVHKKPSEDCNL